MTHPGRVVEVPATPAAPPPLDRATAAICLTLIDHETPLWLDPAARTVEVLEYVRFYCGAALVEAPEDARFALVADPASIFDLRGFDQGTDEEPERSATVVVQVAAFGSGLACRLSGPGIAGESTLRVGGLGDEFWASVRDNHARFPRGVDLMLVAGSRMAALPRTTRVKIA